MKDKETKKKEKEKKRQHNNKVAFGFKIKEFEENLQYKLSNMNLTAYNGFKC